MLASRLILLTISGMAYTKDGSYKQTHNRGSHICSSLPAKCSLDVIHTDAASHQLLNHHSMMRLCMWLNLHQYFNSLLLRFCSFGCSRLCRQLFVHTFTCWPTLALNFHSFSSFEHQKGWALYLIKNLPKQAILVFNNFLRTSCTYGQLRC